MIVVTRLNGPRFAVNPDLLQRVESTPDTILTLIDGTKYIVAETLDQMVELVVAYRSRVVAATLIAAQAPSADVIGSTPIHGSHGSTVPQQHTSPTPSVATMAAVTDPHTGSDTVEVRPIAEPRALRALASVPEAD